MRYQSEMDAQLSGVFWTQLRSARIVPVSGIVNIDEARTRLGEGVHFRRWLDESLRILAAQGYLHCENGVYSVNPDKSKAHSAATAWDEWGACLDGLKDNVNLRAIAALADCALRSLPDIVTGRIRATDVLFPNGSMELVEGVYKGNAIVDYFNETIADLTVAFIEERRALDADAKLRIIEIGAGTGGTSACVLGRLQAYADCIEEYCYTDLSQAFLMHARQAFGNDNPYLTYQTFNVEKPISVQKVRGDSYDIAIATNVIHATRNIKTSLRNVKAVLRTNGVLLLNEINGNSLQMHLTFGLLEGWWLYEDEKLRIPGCPALTSTNWQTILEEEGFRSIFFPTPDAHHLGHQIIAAESNGVVRKKREQLPHAKSQQTDRSANSRRSDPQNRRSSSNLGDFDKADLLEAVNASLVEEVSHLLKIPPKEIDHGTELSAYGFDSIGFTQFASAINKRFDIDTTPAIFYENINIESLSRHLIEDHFESVTRKVTHSLSTKQISRESPRDQPNKNKNTISTTIKRLVPRDEGAPQRYPRNSIFEKESNTESRTISRAKQDKNALVSSVRAILSHEISVHGKIKLEEIDAEAELSAYGFDSIGFASLAKIINEKFDLDVTPAIFYENLSLSSIAKHLVDNHKEHLQKQLLPEEADEKRADVPFSAMGKSGLKVRHGLEDSGASASEPIAIIGISAKFPMSDSIDEYWRNLKEDRKFIREIPKGRWDWEAIYGDPKEERGKTDVKWGGFIDGIEEFDAAFFGFTPQQARAMDPRVRIFLMHAWKVIEDAGYSASQLAGSRTATFLGILAHDGYSDLIRKFPDEVDSRELDLLSAMSPANWVSYFLDLRGPSEPIETACSSSLVAINRAIEALRNKSCDMAIVGGVNAILTPDIHVSLSKYGILSTDGRCKTFSKNADGFVRSEGVGVLLLKPAREAEAAGDHIYGLLLGSAENHNGRTQSLMSPNPKAQSDVVVAAHRRAGVDPHSVTYIEMHGTGTELGDAIEVKGLKDAFKELIGSNQQFRNGPWCGLGSVKGYIGHLESASGIASVIKVLLQFRDRMLVGNPHAEEINPYLQLGGSPFNIVQRTQEWHRLKDDDGQSLPLRAGISAFGAGGVNAHVVMQEYVSQQGRSMSQGSIGKHPVMIVLSARSQSQLKERACQLVEMLTRKDSNNFSLLDMAYTLQVGRDEMDFRLGLVANSFADLRSKLKTYIDSGKGVYEGRASRSNRPNKLAEPDAGKQETIREWLERPESILQAWVKGAIVDWKQLYADRSPRRVSLPTYPFARHRHWIGECRETNELGRETEPVRLQTVSSGAEEGHDGCDQGNAGGIGTSIEAHGDAAPILQPGEHIHAPMAIGVEAAPKNRRRFLGLNNFWARH